MKTPLGLLLISLLLLSCNSTTQSQIGSGSGDLSNFPFKEYDQVETFSFNRNEEIIDSVEKEIERFEASYSYEERSDSSEIALEYEALERIYERGEPSIIDSKDLKTYSKSSQKIKVLSNKELRELRRLFRNINTDDYLDEAMCTPIYRDAIVFKKKGEIVGWLNICFECDKTQSNPDEYFILITDQWKALEAFFIKIGHPIKRGNEYLQSIK